MYYIKHNNERVSLDSEIYTACLTCGKEVEVDIVEEAQSFPDFTLYDGIVCKECGTRHDSSTLIQMADRRKAMLAKMMTPTREQVCAALATIRSHCLDRRNCDNCVMHTGPGPEDCLVAEGDPYTWSIYEDNADGFPVDLLDCEVK